MRIEPIEPRIEPVQGVLRASPRKRRGEEKQQPDEQHGEREQEREEPSGGGLVDVRV